MGQLLTEELANTQKKIEIQGIVTVLFTPKGKADTPHSRNPHAHRKAIQMLRIQFHPEHDLSGQDHQAKQAGPEENQYFQAIFDMRLRVDQVQ